MSCTHFTLAHNQHGLLLICWHDFLRLFKVISLKGVCNLLSVNNGKFDCIFLRQISLQCPNISHIRQSLNPYARHDLCKFIAEIMKFKTLFVFFSNIRYYYEKIQIQIKDKDMIMYKCHTLTLKLTVQQSKLYRKS